MDYKFLINTITDWNEPPRARHQVAEALSKKYDVVFISANRFGIMPVLKKENVSKNLKVIMPFFPIDKRLRYRISLINTIYQTWLFRLLHKKYREYIVINFDFTARHISKYFKKVIYYCNDDYIHISSVSNPAFIVKYHKKCESLVAGSSKFCVATSKFLHEKLTKYNPLTYEIRLGAPDIPYIPENTLNIRTSSDGIINVGFVGYFNTAEKNLIEFLIRKQDLRLILVGPISEKDLTNLKSFNNVTATGRLTGQELYNKVAGFDVGIVPYNMKSTVDRTPNKLWLYLSLGVPVIVSNIKSIEHWEFNNGFVYRANDYDEFYNSIKLAYKENNQNLIKERIAFAGENTWEKRINQLIKVITEVFITEDNK